MSKRIKGLTVAIDGDVTGLKTALKDVDRSISDTKSTLNDVNRLLKFDPTNTELLQQKQKLLASAIGDTKSRLDTLKEAERQAQEQFKRGEIGEEQYNALKREIIATENSLGQLEKSADDNNKALKGMGDSAGKAADDVDDAGVKSEKTSERFEKFIGVVKAVGAAFLTVGAAAGAFAIKIGKEVIQAFGELEQNLGGSEAVFGEYADAIQKAGEDAYKNLGVSQSEYLATANKMGALFQGSGIEQQKSLDLTVQAMQRAADMASVMGIDTQVALDSIAGAAKGNFTMMDNLGVAMNATSLQAYALSKGLVAAGDGAGGAEVDVKKLADAQDKATTAALNFEMAEEKYAASVAKNGENSTQAAQAAISLEKAQVALAAATRKVEETMAPANEEMSNWWKNASQAEKAEVAMQMFFEKTSQYAGNFARESSETITGSIGMMQAALGSFTAGLGNTEADMVKLTQNLVDAFQSVVDNVVPIIKNIVDVLPTVFDAILNAIEDFTPMLLDVSTSLLSQVLETLLKLLPQFIPVAVSIVTTIGSTILDNMPLLINATMQLVSGIAGGIIDALPAIAEAAALIMVMLIGGLADSMPALMSTVMQVCADVVKIIIENIPLFIDAGISLLMGLADGFIGSIDIFVKEAPKVIDALLRGLERAIPALLSAAALMIETLLDGLIKMLPELSKAAIEIVNQIAKFLQENLPTIISMASEVIMALVIGLTKALPELASAAIDIVMALVDFVLKNLPMIVDLAMEVVLTLVEGLVAAIPQITRAAAEITKKFIGYILTHIPEILAMTTQIMISIAGGFLQAIPEILKVIPKIISSILNAFTGGKWGDVGGDIIDGIADGLLGGISKVIKAAQNVAQSAFDAAKKILGIASPSKKFRFLGEMSVEGFDEAFEEGKRKVANITAEFANSAYDGANNAVFTNANAGGGQTSGGTPIINQTNHFTNYTHQDGAAVVRDLNRQLGLAYN